MNRSVIIAVALLAIGVLVAVYFAFRKPAPLREGELTGVMAEFVTILPDDLPPAQTAEIEGLLRRFQAKAEVDQVRPEDYQEVMMLLKEHVEEGSITHDELNLVMAKVGYYSYRAYSRDSSDIHPLLDPTPFPHDSLRTTP
jgi:hypothetical protein